MAVLLIIFCIVVHSTLIEFKIMKDWKSSYAKPKSDEYSKLALQLESEVCFLWIIILQMSKIYLGLNTIFIVFVLGE